MMHKNCENLVLSQEQKNLDRKKDILSLKWTEDCSARLEISPFLAEGLPKYEILVFGENIPYYSGVINVMGDSSNYQDNMMYSNRPIYSPSISSTGCSSFYTSSDHILIAFLQKVNFKKFEYDTKTLKLLQFIQTLFLTKESSSKIKIVGLGYEQFYS